MKDEEKLDVLNEFSEKYMELKQYLLSLKLSDTGNINIAIQYLDDGYLRAREAIFADNREGSLIHKKSANDDKSEDVPPHTGNGIN